MFTVLPVAVRAKQLRLLVLNLGVWKREFSYFSLRAFSNWRRSTILVHVNALVITGGAYPELGAIRHLVDAAELIVAADSGLETAVAYGVRPSVIVGDFDSISDEGLLAGYDEASVRRFSTAKDFTDTELALRAAIEEGADHVYLVGGGGGRVDHLLAIAALFERESPPDLWVTDTSAIRSFDSEVVERGSVGETISFFPLGCVPCRMSSTGLRWPLDSLTWKRGNFGISNEFSGPEARVRVHSGRLLVIRPAGSV